MLRSQISPLVILRERARHRFRELLLYIAVCTFLVAWYSGALDPAYLSSHSIIFVFLVSLVLGSPIALLLWFIVRAIRFAFNR
jgi:hypothetical protein